MFKQTLVTTVVLFILWSVIDFLVHGILLQSAYQETVHLWRSDDEYYAMLVSAVTLIYGFCVVSIDSNFIAPKSLTTGFNYCVALGSGVSALVGLGSFSYMPIPFSLAIAGFGVSFIKLVAAGLVAGYVVKEPATAIGDSAI
jgi:hypothetical protein